MNLEVYTSNMTNDMTRRKNILQRNEYSTRPQNNQYFTITSIVFQMLYYKATSNKLRTIHNFQFAKNIG